MIRYYMPTTIGDLRDQVRQGYLTDLEHFRAQGEHEDDEYAALMWAAEASQEMLRGPGRRVVVVAESKQPLVSVPTPMKDVIAVYADPDPRPTDADSDEDLCWYATQEIDALLAD